jgi:PLAT/LH2 domain
LKAGCEQRVGLDEQGKRAGLRGRRRYVVPPFTQITTLSVRVVTSDEDGAGTDNDVYFDIGPVGWELVKPGSQFEAGSDETYHLVEAGDTLSSNLTTDDIVWLRLQKKGIGGVTGTTDFPSGGWKPKSIHLIINGAEWVSFAIQRWLTQDHPVWAQGIRTGWSRERRFVRTTRVQANAKLAPGDETIALLTTSLFKLQGISGWFGTAIPRTCATGTVIRRAISSDGLATIDLQLAMLNIGGDQRYRLDAGHGIRTPRYIRVEYFFPPAPFSVPRTGQCVHICGTVMWDTDHEGWYEIHPAGPNDVQVLGPGKCDAAALPTHPRLRLRAAIEREFPAANPALGLRVLEPGLGTADLSVRDLIKSSAF